MIAYASRTGTRRNLEALRRAGWRLMVSAKGVLRHEGFRYALDNGAWHAFANRLPFDEKAFLAAFDKLGKGADFVVLPDIVTGAERSLAFSMKWAHELDQSCPQVLAVQDGMSAEMIAPLVGPMRGIFVGGSDEFKEKTLPIWGELARCRQAYLHVGRVNTRRRIFLCEAAGADSFDGSGPSRFLNELGYLDDARKQRDLFQWQNSSYG
jgi:hypothetical protein